MRTLALGALAGLGLVLVQALPASAAGDAQGQTKRVARHHSVYVRALPTPPAGSGQEVVKPHVQPAHLAPTQGEGREAPVRGRSGRPLSTTAATALGPVSAPAVTRTDPPLEELTGFTGIGYDGPTPPDTMAGVGPNDVVEMVNSTGRIYNKAGTQTSSFTLGSFFGAPTITMTSAGYSDPRVIYDARSGRWFASVLIFDRCRPTVCTTTSNSEVDVAVSGSSDPGGSWTIYVVETTTNNVLLDQPKLGFSDDKVLTTYNENGFGGPYRFVVLQKSDLLAAAASAAATFFALDNSHYNVIPAISLTATNNEYAASANRGLSTLTVFTFTGTPAGGGASFSTSNFGIGTINDPPLADQANDSRQLDTGTAGVQSVVWQNDTLWAGGHTGCTPPGDSTTRTCLRIDQVSTSGGVNLQQDVNIGQNGAHLFYPAVTMDAAGNLWIGHSVSSTSFQARAGVTFVPAGLVPSSVPGVDYAFGSGPYDCTFCTAANGDTRNRWGDYSAAVQDPTNPNDIWVAEEFGSTSATNTDLWGTAIARFTVAPPSVSSISPTSGPASSPCTTIVTVNGHDFLAGGTSVQFGAVASPGVSVSTPDRLTAFAPTRGPGVVDVTVTTPDGTSPITAADQFTYVADTTPPTTTVTSITPAPNLAGWRNSDVHISLSASDNVCGTGVASITFSAAGAQTIAPTTVAGSSATVLINVDGVTTVSFHATDNAGNSEAPKSVVIHLDKTPPVITITAPAAATYTLNQAVAAAYTCVNPTSGLVNCTGTVPSGSDFDTSTIGVHTFTVNATDVAGNSSSASVSYTVAFGICLLYDPTHAKHAGSTYPIRLFLCDANGVDVSGSSLTVHATLITPGGVVPVSSANPGNDFTFDPTLGPSGAYIYTLSTKALAPGSYMLHFTADADPTDHMVPFLLS